MKIKIVVAAVCYFILENSQMPNFLKKSYTVDDFWAVGKNTILADPKALFRILIDPDTKDKIVLKRIDKVKKLISKN